MNGQNEGSPHAEMEVHFKMQTPPDRDFEPRDEDVKALHALIDICAKTWALEVLRRRKVEKGKPVEEVLECLREMFSLGDDGPTVEDYVRDFADFDPTLN